LKLKREMSYMADAFIRNAITEIYQRLDKLDKAKTEHLNLIEELKQCIIATENILQKVSDKVFAKKKQD
jgi:prefoldin subunit 5